MTPQIILLIGFIAATVMIWGGITIVRNKGDRTKAMLMFGVAVVILFNAVVFLLPV